jgi:dihydroorotase
VRPHHYCLPVLKREVHREALIEAATGGNPKFFLGTDSAPHARHTKETDCGCAGIYTAHAGIELYAEAFAAAGGLDRLEAFASFHGADFYGLARNRDRVTLVRREWQISPEHPFGGERLVPFRAGGTVAWRLAS